MFARMQAQKRAGHSCPCPFPYLFLQAVIPVIPSQNAVLDSLTPSIDFDACFNLLFTRVSSSRGQGVCSSTDINVGLVLRNRRGNLEDPLSPTLNQFGRYFDKHPPKALNRLLSPRLWQSQCLLGRKKIVGQYPNRFVTGVPLKVAARQSL